MNVFKRSSQPHGICVRSTIEHALTVESDINSSQKPDSADEAWGNRAVRRRFQGASPGECQNGKFGSDFVLANGLDDNNSENVRIILWTPSQAGAGGPTHNGMRAVLAVRPPVTYNYYNRQLLAREMSDRGLEDLTVEHRNDMLLSGAFNSLQANRQEEFEIPL